MPCRRMKQNGKILQLYLPLQKAMLEKNSLEDFININNSGKIAMKLDQDDKIIGVKSVKKIKIFY